MDKKEKYIAKTKGGTDTMSTKDSKLLKLMKSLTGATSDADKLMQFKKISDMLGDVKGVGSFADIKMLKKALPTKKDGGMVKGYKSGGPAIVLGGIGKKIEDSIKTIDLDTAPKKVLGGLAGRLAKRGYGKARR
jgi:hypothetical protein